MTATNMHCEGLRLLIVGTYPPPFGGIATHLTTLIPGLKRRGADDIAVLSFSDRTSVEQKEGFTLYRYDVKEHVRRIARPRSWRMSARVARTMLPHRFPAKLQITEMVKAILVDEVARTHQSNVVSFYQGDMSMQMPALARAWGARRGIVLTVFGEVYEVASGALIRRHPAFFRDMLRYPKALAASSRYCAQSYVQLGVTREIEPVYYGVDLAPIPPERGKTFRSANGIAGDDVVVLFMGRFSKEMGVDVVVNAAGDILRRTPNARIVLAGAKGDESRAAAAAATEFPGRVIVRENVPFSEQSALYSAADMLVAPSFNQRACMGMAIKEGMAAGLAAIGGAGGGVSEAIVDGETGYLVPVDATGTVDVRQFTDRVTQLAGDRELRRRMGDAGRRRAEALFSYETTNDKMARIFMSAVPAR